MSLLRTISTGKLATESGISLLEVLISVVIISIGILGLAPLLTLAIQTNSQSKDYTVVAEIARNKIEYFESLDSLSMPMMPYYENEPSVQGLFSRTTTIIDSTTDTTLGWRTYKIDVSVGWADAANMNRNVNFSTIINN